MIPVLLLAAVGMQGALWGPRTQGLCFERGPSSAAGAAWPRAAGGMGLGLEPGPAGRARASEQVRVRVCMVHVFAWCLHVCPCSCSPAASLRGPAHLPVNRQGVRSPFLLAYAPAPSLGDAGIYMGKYGSAFSPCSVTFKTIQQIQLGPQAQPDGPSQTRWPCKLGVLLSIPAPAPRQARETASSVCALGRQPRSPAPRRRWWGERQAGVGRDEAAGREALGFLAET